MNWNSDKIFQSVTESADKYGAHNPQQEKQLLFVLKKCEGQEIYRGLINVFLEKHNNFSQRQELAGKLLYNLSPDTDKNYEKDIISCLGNYELSVEQLPYFFIKKIGKNGFEKLVNKIQVKELSEKEKEALETMKYWSRNYEQFKGKNG